MMRIINGKDIPLQAFLGDYKPQMFKNVKNAIYGKKPIGGLWTSTFDEIIGSEWVRFCRYDYIDEYKRHEKKGKLELTLIEPRRDTKFILIDSEDDLASMMKQFQIKFERMNEREKKIACELDIFKTSVDFELMAEKYDGIFLTRKGERETRHSLPYNLYGWDVESVLFFNKLAFGVVGKVKIKDEWLIEQCESEL